MPHCKLSESLEQGIARTLSQVYEKVAKDRGCTVAQVEKAENLCVRVVSSLEKKQKVREGVSFFTLHCFPHSERTNILLFALDESKVREERLSFRISSQIKMYTVVSKDSWR